MMTTRAMRIALLTHSTNPRGGVVHVTQLGEALADLGHDVVVHAPDPNNSGFGRPLRCAFAPIPATPLSAPLPELVRQRIAEYTNYFRAQPRDTFDLYHAHDGIGGCALADLAREGHISGFVRTVHHIDDFADPYLSAQQDRSITAAAQVLCVSRLWAAELLGRYRIHAEQIPNGVDMIRFTPTPDPRDEQIRSRFKIDNRSPVFLSIGGVEQRKNTTRILQAFVELKRTLPAAVLLIVGGASLLDHSEYRRSFDELLQNSPLVSARDVLLTGPVADHQMPAIMRVADALVFPSLVEGFGLVVLEAMACGTPVVVSRLEPFTEYLSENDCVFADPLDVNSIAAAMLKACDPARALSLREHGLNVSHRFPWDRSARIHETIYARLIQETCDAGNAISSSMAR